MPLLYPAFLDVPTFATRCLHVHHDVRDPSGGRCNCGRECCPVISSKWRLPRHLGIFNMPQIYDMGPTASAGFEPANLGTKGQHATPRPLKPLLTAVYKCKGCPHGRHTAQHSYRSSAASYFNLMWPNLWTYKGQCNGSTSDCASSTCTHHLHKVNRPHQPIHTTVTPPILRFYTEL